MGEQDRFDALFDLQEVAAEGEERLLLDCAITAEELLGPIGGHGSGNRVERISIPHDAGEQRAFFKPANGLHKVTLDRYGQTRASSTIAEAVAWRLAAALGEPYRRLVAPCVVRFVSALGDRHALGALSLERPGDTESNAPFSAGPQQCRDAAFFDALIGQQDRHGGNWLWDPGERRLYLFDHGCSMARRGDISNRSEIAVHRRTASAGKLTRSEIDAAQRLVASDDTFGLKPVLEAGRLASLRARARAMASKPHMLLQRGAFH